MRSICAAQARCLRQQVVHRGGCEQALDLAEVGIPPEER
jgi:hypothetical protein